MTKPFVPPKGVTVEIPYRNLVLRADPDFEYAVRHEPFYEFDGRSFNEDTKKHGAYNFVPISIAFALTGVAAAASVGEIDPSIDLQFFVNLTGVEAAGQIGAIAITNVTPVLLPGAAGTGTIGAIAPFGQSVINGSANLAGVSSLTIAGSIFTTGQQNAAFNLTGLHATTAIGSIIVNSSSNATVHPLGVAATGARGIITLSIVNGSASASANLLGRSATGAVGIINQGQLQQPILTLTSASGVTNPTFTFTIDSSIVAGDTLEFEEQVSAGDWSSPVVDVTHTFTSGEIIAGEVDLGLAARTSGTYDSRMRVSHGAVTSAWSDVVTFTVSSPASVIGTPLGLLAAITAGNSLSDSDTPGADNRPTMIAGTETLSWIGPSGGGVNNGSPVLQTRTLTASGSVVSTSNGQTIQGLDIAGTVRIRHSNVTLKQCRITSSDIFIVECDSGSPTGVVVEDCMIDGGGNAVTGPGSWGWNPDGGGGGSIIRRCNLTGTENGVGIGENSMHIEDNWIHDLASAPTRHTDGIQSTGGFTALTINHNAIFGTDTGCVTMGNDVLGFSGLVVSNNLLVMQSGSACILIRGDKGPGTVGACSVTNNKMGKGGSYNDIQSITGPLTYTGNVDWITGAAIASTD